jgi:hypothetical protein
MAAPQPPPNRIWFSVALRDTDLVRLARAALNVHAAQQFAQEHGLDVHEDPSKDDVDVALLVPTGRLAEILRELTDEGIAFGTVDCFEPDADAICQSLSAVSVLLEEA